MYDSSSPTPSKQPVLAMSISGEVDEGDFATARRGGGRGRKGLESEERVGGSSYVYVSEREGAR